MLLSNKYIAFILLTGIFLVSLLFSAGEFLQLETNDPLLDLNTALAVSTPNSTISSEGSNSILSSNISAPTTNSTDTTAANGSISIITPQEIKDRRHAPS